ncbi:MAG: dihydropteroate synthase [Planctomycetes bacterium]|nr:dihydropteroate synthase [Planctomycetota bacterium]
MAHDDIALSVTHNPRVLDASLTPLAESEMRSAGVTEYGIAVMAPKARHFSLVLENVSRLHANLIKQHVLSLGAEAAVHKHIPTEQVDVTTLLLTGTDAQLRRLAGKLRDQPFGLPAVGDLVLRTVAGYRCRSWTIRCGSGSVELGPKPVIMGILNVTPDSFSDGGQWQDAGCAVDHALAMQAAGAAMIDVGGESTRPGADAVPADEEIRRTVPVVAALRRQSDVLISIDTHKARVAVAALDAGADIVNDISALSDAEMPALLADRGCPVVLMHMQGRPQTMQQNPTYEHVVADVCRRLRQALQRAAEAGVDLGQTIVDPGIGFGKTAEHNLALLGRLKELRSLGRPILVGTSRKSFIGKILDAEVDNRLMGSVATCVWARAQGAAMFRIHDVAETAAALQIIAAIQSAEDTD